jgi:hypothetical protein
VAAEIVHHDDVAVPQVGYQPLLDISLEEFAVDRPVEHNGGDLTAVAQAGGEGGGLPMSMQNGST